MATVLRGMGGWSEKKELWGFFDGWLFTSFCIANSKTHVLTHDKPNVLWGKVCCKLKRRPFFVSKCLNTHDPFFDYCTVVP